MAAEEIEIVIRGGAGSGAYTVAQAVARALEKEGAFVDLRSIPIAVAGELAPDALFGANVRVRLAPAATGIAPGTTPVQDGCAGGSSTGMVQAAKIAIGVVLLLMLFGTELRLHFGMKFGTFVTLAAIWVFWRFALKRPAAAP